MHNGKYFGQCGSHEGLPEVPSLGKPYILNTHLQINQNVLRRGFRISSDRQRCLSKRCKGCTICCLIPKVPELKKPNGKLCTFCNKDGCTIYKERPSDCRQFECAWLQSGASLDLRPDKCGILFERMNEKTFFGTLVPGRKISQVSEGQIKAFLRDGFSVIVRDIQTDLFLLREDHVSRVLSDIEVKLLVKG